MKVATRAVARVPRATGATALTMAQRKALRQLSIADYVAGVRGGDRSVLARAITLIESARPEHQALAQAVLVELLPHTGTAQRIGITGVPGVGKSTFIDGFGHPADGPRAQGGGAGGRPVEHTHRRIDPRRQDTNGSPLG